MKHSMMLAPASVRESGAPLSTVGWYAIALMATSISHFAYLFVLRRVIAHAPSATLENMAALYWTAGLSAPVGVALKGLALGAILWASLTLFNVKAAFLHCLRIAWSAEALLALPQIIHAAVGLARGATKQADLFLPLGLDLFWKPAGTSFGILSHAVTVFLIAWSAVIWVRLKRHTADETRAWPVAVTTMLATAVIVLLPILQFGS